MSKLAENGFVLFVEEPGTEIDLAERPGLLVFQHILDAESDDSSQQPIGRG